MGARPQALGAAAFDSLVQTVAWAPDGRSVAVGCADHTIQLCDPGRDRSSGVLAGHKRRILSLAYSPDGQTLASTDGPTIKLWHVATGREMLTVYRDVKIGEPVQWLAFTRDGLNLLAADATGQVQIYFAPPLDQLTQFAGQP